MTELSIINSKLSNGNSFQYPLEHDWEFSIFKFENDLKAIYTIQYVEEFWQVMNHSNRPSSFEFPCNYVFFLKDKKMSWTIPENSDGGRWIISVPHNAMMIDKKTRNKVELIDYLWEQILLFLIGNTLDLKENNILGAVINIRPGKIFRINIWSNENDKDKLMQQGKNIRKILKIPKEKISLEFKKHSEVNKNVSTRNTPAFISC